MQIRQTEREFRYTGGLVLPDPDPSLGIEAVRQVYASSYPEMITAAVSGPELVDGKTGLHVQNGSGHKELTGQVVADPKRCAICGGKPR